ncbi:MAG: S8 family serine peptidase [Actinomycetota bacterium]
MIALALTSGLVMAASSATAGGKIDAKVLRAVKGGKAATYWAILRRSADLSGASSIADWDARGAFVVDRLRAVANASQLGLKAMLSSQGVSHESFWIINALRITSKAATLQAVAAREEVASIVPDRSAIVPKPIKSPDIDAIEWNIMRINADDVWNSYNDRGEGITVANIDTGVQWNHPALIKQYRGICVFQCLTVNHNYNWYDPSRVCHPQGRTPCDNNGHGTHVMGTMVGDDRGPNQIGVAPRAYWIAAKGCESSSCSLDALLKSGQWMLAPTDLNDQNPRADLRPHVINNSWGSGNGRDEFYRATVQAWVASGIFPVFAVGGGGPGCGTVGAPASYPESYGVSAFDMNNDIASFASRGPSPLDGGIKPDIAAPGVSIRSSVPPNSYAIFSGTSMSTPHVAGTVALIWSINGAPSFSRNIPATMAVLDDTAIDVSNLTCGGDPDNNNVWGEGRLDAFAAVTAAREA